MEVDPDRIPEDLIPVCTPDRYRDDPHRLYLAILDVIMNEHLALEGIDPATLATCLSQLREENLIVLKNGRPEDSGDYHDYMPSPDRNRFYSWHNSRSKDSISILKTLVSLFARLFMR